MFCVLPLCSFLGARSPLSQGFLLAPSVIANANGLGLPPSFLRFAGCFTRRQQRETFSLKKIGILQSLQKFEILAYVQ